MAEDAQIDPDFEPQARPRSCTWPMNRPGNMVKKQANEVNIKHQSTINVEQTMVVNTSPSGQATPAVVKTKSSSRKNAWGNMSYADLITQGIESSPEKRLTLAQIYDWMVKNVAYFKDKGDSNSSAGWKVIDDFL